LATLIDASSTNLAVPPHTDPDSLMTVVTSPSVVMVPTQVPSPAAASSWVAQAVNDKATTEAATANRTFMRRRLVGRAHRFI